MPYQITVNSADITQDYNGEDITVNADETDRLNKKTSAIRRDCGPNDTKFIL